MAHGVCPWWLGYFLVTPLRRWRNNPPALLRPFVTSGMTVLEPGCGMGFFTIDLARLVGPGGRVIAIDIQRRMLDGLGRRARKAGVADRIDARLARADGLGIADVEGRVDFTLAFAMVHELPDTARFFAEVRSALKPGGTVLVAEPRGHVTESEFAAMLVAAKAAGFLTEAGPEIRANRVAVLRRA